MGAGSDEPARLMAGAGSKYLGAGLFEDVHATRGSVWVESMEWEGEHTETHRIDIGPGLSVGGVFTTLWRALRYLRQYENDSPAKYLRGDAEPGVVNPDAISIWLCDKCDDVKGDGCCECTQLLLTLFRLNPG